MARKHFLLYSNNDSSLRLKTVPYFAEGRQIPREDEFPVMILDWDQGERPSVNGAYDSKAFTPEGVFSRQMPHLPHQFVPGPRPEGGAYR